MIKFIHDEWDKLLLAGLFVITGSAVVFIDMSESGKQWAMQAAGGFAASLITIVTGKFRAQTQTMSEPPNKTITTTQVQS